jgi:hypothetical protein
MNPPAHGADHMVRPGTFLHLLMSIESAGRGGVHDPTLAQPKAPGLVFLYLGQYLF